MFEEFSLALGGDFESAESVCNVWSGPNCDTADCGATWQLGAARERAG